jgi:hypothetical protein
MTCSCTATTCCQSRHRAMKLSPDLMALNADYVGMQRDHGYDSLALHNCRRCKSTIAVRVVEREAA